MNMGEGASKVHVCMHTENLQNSGVLHWRNIDFGVMVWFGSIGGGGCDWGGNR